MWRKSFGSKAEDDRIESSFCCNLHISETFFLSASGKVNETLFIVSIQRDEKTSINNPANLADRARVQREKYPDIALLTQVVHPDTQEIARNPFLCIHFSKLRQTLLKTRAICCYALTSRRSASTDMCDTVTL